MAVKTASVLAMAIALLSVRCSQAAGAPAVSYTRAGLIQEQKQVHQHVEQAIRRNDAAARLLDEGLVAEGSEELIQALFLADLPEVSMEGHLGRVEQLKSTPLSYARREEQAKLTAGYAALQAELQGLHERAAKLRLRCPVTNDHAVLVLQVFLLKRENFRTRMRHDLVEPAVALDECRRLAVLPLALVANGVVNVENAARCRMNADGSVTFPDGRRVAVGAAKAKPEMEDAPAGAELAQLQRERQQMQGEIERLRSSVREASRTNVVREVITNYATRTVERPVLVPVAAPTTNWVTAYRTNIVTHHVTNAADVFGQQQAALAGTNSQTPKSAFAALPPSARPNHSAEPLPDQPAPKVAAATRGGAGVRAPNSQAARWVWGGSVAGALVVCAFLVVWLRIRRIEGEPELGASVEVESAPATTAALLVTEREDANEQGTEARVLRRAESVPLATNAPVTFGTNPESSTLVVAPVAGMDATELFKVTMREKGALFLTAAVDALVNGKPVPKKGQELNSDRSFTVRIGHRQWDLTPAAETDGRSTVVGLFNRIMPTRRTSAITQENHSMEIKHA